MKKSGWIVVLTALIYCGPLVAQGLDHEPFRFQQFEIEPNNDPWNATSLTRNSYGSGGISPWGDIDYRFVLLINGVLVSVELQRFTID